MSQPQKASLVSNATCTYSVAVQDVLTLQKHPTNETSLQGIRGRLLHLRRLITCCACGGLLDDAMVSTCDHHYCFGCQFKEPLLPIHCRQCRDRNNLVPALQLRTLVLCYHNLCHLLATFYTPGMAACTSVVTGGDASPHPPDECDPIEELLKEASSVDYKCPPSVFRMKRPKSSHSAGLSHLSSTSTPGSPPLKCESQQQQQQPEGNTQTGTPNIHTGSPLTGVEERSVTECRNSTPVLSEVSSPTNTECFRVQSETKQGKDEDVVKCSEHKIHPPTATSFTTGSSGSVSSTNGTSAKQPIANMAKRRKVNRNWK